MEDPRPLKAMEEEYYITRLWSRAYQLLYETAMIHEVQSDYRVFDFTSFAKGECRLEERFREFGLADWCSCKGKICIE